MSTGPALDIPEHTSPYPRYDAYKDSGVEWLGEIPEHWEVVRLKFRSTFKGGGTPSKDNRDYWNGDIPWVSPKDMKVDVVQDTEDHITQEAVRESSTSLVAPGSVLIVVRSGILKHTIPVATNAVEVALNQDLKAITPDPRLDPRYLAYLICGKNDVLLLEWTKSGTTVESLEHDRIANTETPIPPLPEQRAIAAYLDRETERIDTLIDKKERLIELLEEKRTALISHAVTKGLDDDAEMKDSGVEWLGEIPAGWEVIKLRWLTENIEQGWSPSAQDQEAAEDEWGVITLSAVKQGTFYPAEHKRLPPDKDPKPRYEIQAGDFLLTRANTPELVGDACYVRETRGRLMMSDLVYRLDLRSDLVDSRFLTYWMLSRNGRHQVERSARGSSKSMVKVSQSHIKSWLAALPLLSEQRRVADYLDKQMSRHDQLMERIRDGIDRLKEYRTALISAAVTGQIDVREGA